MIGKNTRLIDAQDTFNVLSDYYHHNSSTQHLALQEALNKVPTVDAIPVEWILNNERMPKAGTGRKAIMDMIEDWEKENAAVD